MADVNYSQLGALGAVANGDLVALWPVAGPGPLKTISANALRGYMTALLGSASLQAIGTSGANVPLLNGANTWSAPQSFVSATIASATITGVTNASNAGAGIVGEYVSSIVTSGSALPMTSGVPLNVTSITLSAGDWDVSGNVFTSPEAGTLTSSFQGAVSTASATFPGAAASAITYPAAVAGAFLGLACGTTRINVSAPTTVYLVAAAVFSAGTLAAYGVINARRMR